MLTMMVAKAVLDSLLAGKTNEIHKKKSDYFTCRFKRVFDSLVDSSPAELILRGGTDWKNENTKIAKCTLTTKSCTPEDEYSRQFGFDYQEERYVLTVLEIRDNDYMQKTNTKHIAKGELIELLRKKMAEETDPDNKDKYNAMIELFKDNRTYEDGYQRGYNKGCWDTNNSFEASKGIQEPREVINTEGYSPYCQVCRSSDAIYTKDSRRNVFCGKCGALLDWTAVKENKDNYKKIKGRAVFGQLSRQYYQRKKAIDYKLSQPSVAKAPDNNEAYPAPPEEAKINPNRKRGK